VCCDRRGNRIASIKKSFATAVRSAGLGDVHAHDLRRTCGSWLVQANVPIHHVSALLRHSDIRVTDRVYAHLAPENVRLGVQALEGRTAQSGHIHVPTQPEERG
jgi:integrase